MTKAEIVNEISKKTGIDKATVLTAVEAFMESVKESLIQKEDNVYLRGFGSFILKKRAKKTSTTFRPLSRLRSLLMQSRSKNHSNRKR